MRLKGISGDDKGKILTAEWGVAQQLLQTGDYVEVDDDGNPVGPPAGEDHPTPNYAGKTRAELDAVAVDKGIDPATARTKDELIQLIEGQPA
jgi:hypothetical protein